jgi:hypothetical protein
LNRSQQLYQELQAGYRVIGFVLTRDPGIPTNLQDERGSAPGAIGSFSLEERLLTFDLDLPQAVVYIDSALPTDYRREVCAAKA